MIPLNINISHPTLLRSSYSLISLPSPFPTHFSPLKHIPRATVRVKQGRGICRAELQQEAPFAIAIGASILNSFLFTRYGSLGSYDFGRDDVDEDEDEDAAVSTTDARFAVMTVISFIPYFNWLSWVFALMDTGKQRYAVYALVYLAPYLRTNLSLSPDESWLPIASIVLCIIHIQLEASISSGDLDSFNFFNEMGKRLGLINLKKDSPRKKHEGRKHNSMNLLSRQQQSRDEIRKWTVPRKPSEDPENVNENGGRDDGTKH